MIAGPTEKEKITNIAMAGFTFTINLPNTSYGQVYYADTTIALPDWFDGFEVYAASMYVTGSNLTTWIVLPGSICGLHSAGERITIRAYRPQSGSGTTSARLIVMGVKKRAS